MGAWQGKSIAPIDLDGTSSAASDDPVLEWRNTDERRDVMLNSSDPAVAFVSITYRRSIGVDGRPAGSWRVEYAAVHSWASSTRRGVGASTRHVLYSADGPMPTLDILALRDMPAWLTRTVGERSPNGAPATQPDPLVVDECVDEANGATLVRCALCPPAHALMAYGENEDDARAKLGRHTRVKHGVPPWGPS